MKTFDINQEVVRSKGDYVVGRKGKIVAIDNEKKRAQVEWYHSPKTWVSFNSIELTSVPYSIIPEFRKRDGRLSNPKYVKSVIILENE